MRVAFNGMADDIKKLHIPLKTVTEDIEELKVTLRKVTQDIQNETLMDIEKVAEDLEVMKIKGFKNETLMDTEKEDTVD